MKSILFKTNIKRLKAAMTLANTMPHYFKGVRIEFEAIQKNFQMLISGPKLKPAKVISTMKELGYKFEVADKVTVWRNGN
jgi:hypothetical protein